MIKKIAKKGIRFYKRYGLRGSIAVLTQMGQIKDRDYVKWYRSHQVTEEELVEQRNIHFSYEPLISILVPVYNTPIPFLEDMISSVQKQSYGNWQLCIANADPSNQEVGNVLRKIIRKDTRIQVVDVPENRGIAQNTNKALEIAAGEYIGLLDHDDMLSPDALYEVVKELNGSEEPDVIYTDEDKITMDGQQHFQPNFKPQFNLDMLRSNNYICHFFVAKKTLIDKVGGFHEEYNGAQDHDLIFRCVEQAEGIVRIPKILYHWRMHKESTAENPQSKSYAFLAGQRAVQDHLKRCGEEAVVELTENPGFFRVKYQINEKPFVSVVVVNRKNKRISKSVLKELAQDYGSDYLEFRTVDDRNGQTMSRINQEIRNCKGEYILLLSSDIQKIEKGYLTELVANIIRKGVGIVGGKLYYPSQTIYHAGLAQKKDGTAEAVFRGLPKVCIGYMNRQSMQQNVYAVTTEALMTCKDVWKRVKGLNEKLCGQECAIDYCRKVVEAGYLVVYDPYAEGVIVQKRLH